MTRTTSPGLARVQAERTSPVLAHVQAEREMQNERWGWMNDALHSDDDWNGLITSRLTRPGASTTGTVTQCAR